MTKLPSFDNFCAMTHEHRLLTCKAASRWLPDFTLAPLGNGVDILPTFVHFNTGIPFKLVLGGAFQMGCGDAEEDAARRIEDPPPITFDELRPVRTERIEAFLMSIAPVLIGEYLWLGKKVPGERGWPNHPVAVSRDDAISAAAELGCRIPREREWEYACRATTQTLFVWGDELLPESQLQPWLDNNFAGNLPRACNRFGLKGLFSGEWCLDEYRSNYSPSTKPQQGEYVIRGGGSRFWPWQDSGEWVWCMSAMRLPSRDLFEDRLCCFRLVYDLPNQVQQ